MHAHLMNTLAQAHSDDLRRMAAASRAGGTEAPARARRLPWLGRRAGSAGNRSIRPVLRRA